MTTSKEHVLDWLRDAHAAEEQAHTMLRRTAGQMDGYAEFRAGLERHSELSKAQAARLKACLEGLGESTSALKTLTGKLTAFGQSLSGYVVDDEPVKAALATSTFARMEVTSYRILIGGASLAGLNEVKLLCEALHAEEVQFAQWLEQQSDAVTRAYLTSEQAKA